MGRRARSGTVVLLVSGLSSHVFGLLGVVRRLAAMGFAVEVWGEPSASRLVQKQGFAFQALTGVRYCHDRILFTGLAGLLRQPATVGRMFSTSRSRRASLQKDLELLSASLQTQLARVTPMLVLMDPLLVAYYPWFKSRGIRCVLLQDKPLPTPDPLVPPPTSSWIPRAGRSSRLLVGAQWALEHAADALRNVRSAIADRLGFYTSDQLISAVENEAAVPDALRARRRLSYDLYFPDQEEWVLSAPEMDYPRARALPGVVRYIGPCVDLQRTEPESPVARAATTRHLIYVSMGTSIPSWDFHVPLLRRIVQAFGGLDGVQLVVSAGSVAARAALRNSFTNVQVLVLLPQLKLLRIADLAIVHAGANALRESIVTETPMLAIPREYDQLGNAARIVHHGLGLRAGQGASAAEIRRKGLQILEDAAFKRRIRECHSAVTTAESVLFAQAVEPMLEHAPAQARSAL